MPLWYKTLLPRQNTSGSAMPSLPNWRDRLIAMVLRKTGLRIDDVLGLLVKQCRLEGPDSIIYVRRTKKRRQPEYDPIYINPGLQLRDYIKGQQMAQTEQVFGNSGTSGGGGKR